MYETILVPTDGSEPADRGVDYGLNLAERFDATVVFLSVVDERRHGRPPALGSLEAEHEAVEEHALEMLAGLVDRARNAGLEAETECCRGLPWEQIVSRADRIDADLIVMGRRGATDDRRTPLGSVTERVVRLSDRPVQAV